MCLLRFILFFLVIPGNGHRQHMENRLMQRNYYQEHSSCKSLAELNHFRTEGPRPLRMLAALLSACNPVAGWQSSFTGRCCNLARTTPNGNPSQSYRLAMNIPSGIPARSMPSLMGFYGSRQPKKVEKELDLDFSEALDEGPPEDLPITLEEMIQQAVSASLRASKDGVQRQLMRVWLPRGIELAPPDEAWSGGIMELYRACSPTTREMLRQLCLASSGDEPTLVEQRLDESRVDGESVWFAQCSKPENDAVAMVQPSFDRMKDIRDVDFQTGPRRPFLIVNPQWKEVGDPFDAMTKKGGLLGIVGKAAGGKKSRSQELEELGFEEIYTLSEYIQKGNRICLFKSYPFGWCLFYLKKDPKQWVRLFTGRKDRPTGPEVTQALIDNDVPFSVTADGFSAL